MGTWDSTYTSSANKAPLIYIWAKMGRNRTKSDEIGPFFTQIDGNWTKIGRKIDTFEEKTNQISSYWTISDQNWSKSDENLAEISLKFCFCKKLDLIWQKWEFCFPNLSEPQSVLKMSKIWRLFIYLQQNLFWIIFS